MSLKLVFLKGDISFPKFSYLVFVFRDKTTKVAFSSEEELIEGGEGRCMFRSFLSRDEYSADVNRMELMIDNSFVNHVRWFDVEETKEGDFVITIKKYEPKVSFTKYLGSVFTLGLLGCVFLKEKNEDVKRVASHLDRAQKELCDGVALRDFGQKVQEIFGENDVGHLKSIKDRHDEIINYFSEQEIRTIRKIREGIDGWEKLERDLEELGRYGDFGFIKDRLEFGRKVFQILGIDRVDQIQEFKDNYLASANNTVSDFYISEDDQKIIRKLQNRKGGLSQLDQDMDEIQEHGTFESIRKKLEFGKEVSMAFGTEDIGNIKKYRENHELAISALDDYKRELDSLGSSEDREIIKKLKYYDGGFEELERDLNELKAQGGLQEIKNQLMFGKQVTQLFGSNDIEKLKEEWKRIPQLEQQIADRDNDLKRWVNVAKGKDLTYMESISDKSASEGRTNQGKVLEQQIEDILSKIDSYDSENNFDWEPQYHKGNDKLDFLIDIKNKHGQNFRVVVECKWHGSKYDEDLGYFAEKEDEKKLRDNVRSWTKQLGGYYDQTKADIGLIVTNISIGGVNREDLITHIPKTYIHDDYKEQGMNLMVAHHSRFEQLISVFRFFMNVCRPQIEIPLTTEQMEQYYHDPVVREGLLEIMNSYQQAFRFWDRAKKKVDSLAKDVSLVQKYMSNFDKHINIQHEQIKKFQINSEAYSGAPLQLEGTTNDAVIAEEIEETIEE